VADLLDAKLMRGHPTARELRERKRHLPRRVFTDADEEVFITLICTACGKAKPLSKFGLRRMADGSLRNCPWCSPCRSGASARSRAKRSALRPPVLAEG
jgi:hypothetical protein